jgi:anti-anti-sigma factor
MEWTIDAKTGTGPIFVRVVGEMDLYNAPKFAQAILAQISTGGRKLLIDMTEMHYLDSSGVGALIRIIQQMTQVQGDVRFTGLGGSPRKVLEMSNIISLMKVHTHEEEVLKLWGEKT